MKVPVEVKNPKSPNNVNTLDLTTQPKRKRGRPVGSTKFNKEELISINQELGEYVDKEEDPTLAGFIVSQHRHLNKDYLSSNEIFKDNVKKLVYKQETFLTKQFKNPTLAIFRLKQPLHGYSDKTEVETKNLHVHVADMKLSKDFTKFLKNETKRV